MPFFYKAFSAMKLAEDSPSNLNTSGSLYRLYDAFMSNSEVNFIRQEILGLPHWSISKHMKRQTNMSISYYDDDVKAADHSEGLELNPMPDPASSVEIAQGIMTYNVRPSSKT